MLSCKNIIINGHRTSMRLDSETWFCLKDICQRESIKLHDLCTKINRVKGKSSLTASTRLFVLLYFRSLLNKYEGKNLPFILDFSPQKVLEAA